MTWHSAAPVPEQRPNPLGWLFLAAAVLVLGVFGLLTYEWVALVTAWFPPITWEVDRATQQHETAVLVVDSVLMFVLGTLVGHFWHRETPANFLRRLRRLVRP